MSGRFLVLAALLGLGACAASHSPLAMSPHARPSAQAEGVALRPAEGLWAILDPGCAKPSAADIHSWPACASPFWISGDKALVILAGRFAQTGVHDVSYTADYSLSPGDPLIAQVGTRKDGYVYLALTDVTRDGQGHIVGAVGAAVACPRPARGVLMLKPNQGGCDADDPASVRKAAEAALADQAALTEVTWIAAGAPAT